MPCLNCESPAPAVKYHVMLWVQRMQPNWAWPRAACARSPASPRIDNVSTYPILVLSKTRWAFDDVSVKKWISMSSLTSLLRRCGLTLGGSRRAWEVRRAYLPRVQDQASTGKHGFAALPPGAALILSISLDEPLWAWILLWQVIRQDQLRRRSEVWSLEFRVCAVDGVFENLEVHLVAPAMFDIKGAKVGFSQKSSLRLIAFSALLPPESPTVGRRPRRLTLTEPQQSTRAVFQSASN